MSFFKPTRQLIILTFFVFSPLVFIPFCSFNKPSAPLDYVKRIDSRADIAGCLVEIIYVVAPLKVYSDILHLPFVHRFNWYLNDHISYRFALLMNFVIVYLFFCLLRYFYLHALSKNWVTS